MLKATAIAEEPQQRLGLRLLGAERQAVADMALGLNLRGIRLQLVPGLGRIGDPGLGEQLLVVEEGARAGGEGNAVLLALIAAERLEYRHRVAGIAQHVAGFVEQTLLRIIRRNSRPR